MENCVKALCVEKSFFIGSSYYNLFANLVGEVHLAHETKFTKEEYENIVNECLMKIKKKIERNEKILENSEEENMSEEEIEKLELWTCNGEWDIYRNLRKMMINEYGFKELDKPLYTFVLRDGFYGQTQVEKNRVID